MLYYILYWDTIGHGWEHHWLVDNLMLFPCKPPQNRNYFIWRLFSFLWSSLFWMTMKISQGIRIKWGIIQNKLTTKFGPRTGPPLSRRSIQSASITHTIALATPASQSYSSLRSVVSPRQTSLHSQTWQTNTKQADGQKWAEGDQITGIELLTQEQKRRGRDSGQTEVIRIRINNTL